MNKNTIIKKLRSNKTALEKQFNISKIGLFGSYSSNNFNDDSDVDLVFELKDKHKVGLNDLLKFRSSE